jgi:hypothetical protein
MSDDIRGSAPVMTTKDVILELRSDVKLLGRDVSEIKREQSVVADHLRREQSRDAERNDRLTEIRTGLASRIDVHALEIDKLNSFRDKTEGAIILARWALGASLLAAIAVVAQFLLSVSGHPAT